MDAPADLSAALVAAEHALRAHGLTGAAAFDALLDGLEHRLSGGRAPPAHVAEVAATIPLRAGTDLFGLAYERFFPDLFKGLRGQFFTPPPLARLLWSRLPPVSTVADPTCGSGGLLIGAGGARARGVDIDPRLARLAAVNLRLAGVRADITCGDVFLTEPEEVDAVIANPPFSVPISDRARLDRFALGRGRTRVSSDHLFLEALEGWVRPGGWAALVLPFSIVANPSTAAIRDRVDRAWVRRAVCALPEGVFRPFGGAAGRAVLLWLQRRPAPEGPCAWAELADPGYDVRASVVRRTSDAEVNARCAGEGWSPLPPGAWTPAGASGGALTVGDLARIRPRATAHAARVADLADVDRGGELLPRPAGDERSARVELRPGDVVVSRLRPNLGNVARVPPGERVVGSPEWIVLEPVRHPGWLLHALRSPTWRASLPVATGQTRPRTTAEAVRDAPVPFPDAALAARVDALSARWLDARRVAGERLEALQRAVDGFAAGGAIAELSAAVEALERLTSADEDRAPRG